MKRIQSTLLSALLLTGAVALQLCPRDASAQASPHPPIAPCAGLTTTAAMLDCEQSRYTQSQSDLKAVYAQLQRQLAPAARNRLAASEAAWVRFLQSSAAFEGSAAEGGTLGPLLQVTTEADLTEQRIAELKKHLQ